jgi:mono/diheme cytochrome c family protein
VVHTFKILGLGLTCAVASARAQRPHTDELTGQQLYVAACANCHGSDGRGATQSQVGFDDAIPDFTDCSFASREAAQDWQAVVHDGGPVRAFSHRMPAFGSALTSAQIERVVDYVRILCSDASWPRGELNLPRPIATEKAFPEDEWIIEADAITQRGGREANGALIYERRFGARSQWELVIPFGVREGSDGKLTRAQPGDVALAIKHAIAHSGRFGSIVSLQTEVVLPTGDPEVGMGSGTTIVEPSVLFGQALPHNAFIQAQAGAGISTNKGKAADEAFARAAVGITVARGFGRAWTPMLEIDGARDLDGVAENVWDLIPQLQVSLTRRQHILASVGVRTPLTARENRKWQLVAYVLWDWFDGALFDGWR